MDPRLTAFAGHKVSPWPCSFSARPALLASAQAFRDMPSRHALLSWIHSAITMVVVSSILAVSGLFVILRTREASRDHARKIDASDTSEWLVWSIITH
jgi:hypothetical protein